MKSQQKAGIWLVITCSFLKLYSAELRLTSQNLIIESIMRPQASNGINRLRHRGRTTCHLIVYGPEVFNLATTSTKLMIKLSVKKKMDHPSSLHLPVSGFVNLEATVRNLREIINRSWLTTNSYTPRHLTIFLISDLIPSYWAWVG